MEDRLDVTATEIKGLKQALTKIWRRLQEYLPLLSSSIGTKELRARSALVAGLVAAFDVSELADLIYELGINPEEIRGETISERARELVQYVERNGMLPVLVGACEIKRPSMDWPIME